MKKSEYKNLAKLVNIKLKKRKPLPTSSTTAEKPELKNGVISFFPA